MTDDRDSPLRRWLRAVLAPLRGGAGQGRLGKPKVRRYGGYAALQFTRRQTQSRMRVDAPDLLLIDYTRTMLGALLLCPQPARIGMIGLGGGSQAKFCYRHLPAARVEVAENNPQVVALRREFRIPDDDDRLQVILDDGARFLRERPGRYDLLLVDGYDETGIPEALATPAFYADCRAALRTPGAMAVNLFCADHARHLALLREAFGVRMVVVEEAKMSNRVAIAWRGDPLPPGPVDTLPVLARLDETARRQLAPVFTRVAAQLDRRAAAAD